MSLDQSHLSCFTSLIFIIWFHTGRLINILSCIIARIRGYICLQSAGYKFCNLTSFICTSALRRKIKNINNICLKFIMWTDNSQIFRNCFVIIYCHLTRLSSQINNSIILEPNELSITLSTLRLYCPILTWIS